MSKLKNKYLFADKKIFFCFLYAILAATILLPSGACCQCAENEIYNKAAAIEANSSLSATQKLNAFYALKIESERCKLPEDSVYAKILEEISVLEFRAKNYTVALSYALDALRINNSGRKNCSKLQAVKNYSTLAHYYDQMLLFVKALAYYDSTITLSANVGTLNYIIDARLYKSYVYFRAGDFQKGVEESTVGLALCKMNNDTLSFLRFLNQRAQSLFFQDKLEQADQDVKSAIQLATNLNQPLQLASAYKMKGFICARRRDFPSAETSFIRSIGARLLTKDYGQIASDYNDFGNFYRDSARLYDKAKECYRKGISYAQNIADSIRLGMINVNLTRTFFYEHNYPQAESSYLNQMQFFNLSAGNDFLLNPPAQAINLVGNKHIITAILKDKIALLLTEYQQTKHKKYLSATLQTARVADSVITQTRYEQVGQQSKLYWRNNTRELYNNSIDACYLANDPAAAFFFLEKSRAVLLSDRLNELGAMAHLPPAESAKQEAFQIALTEQEQKLSTLNDNSNDYFVQQNKLLHAKENFEHYIKSLEQKYPAYYQYKYDDEVPTLTDLQKYLAKNNQSFVDYFIGDTVSYILAITPQSAKFIRLTQEEFNREQLVSFLQLFSDKEKLNSNYAAFAATSNSLYKMLFQKLQLPKGRVIICSDNFLIPFDALCDDASGKHFLLYDYTFSYVYSARYLMKPFSNPTAVGNFLGFAPVSFANYLDVPPLKNAADALHASAAFYKNDKLFTGQNATRSNFFNYASSYSVVSIFSHARADTTENEPVLFMQDSVIHLSELQRLSNPAAKLVLLSACQTNIGKNATGEGVYSLARGFSSAGIPSVVATMWKADEQTIYAISEKFNEYLSHGMSKDEALQKAKLFFIQNNGNEKMLPYYWANMIVIGNTDAINLATKQNNYWWWIAGVCCLVLAGLWIFRTRVFIKTNNKMN